MQVAMEMLCALGEIYGAEKLIPVKSAHCAGLSLKSHGIAGMKWVEDMANIVLLPICLDMSIHMIEYCIDQRVDGMILNALGRGHVPTPVVAPVERAV